MQRDNWFNKEGRSQGQDKAFRQGKIGLEDLEGKSLFLQAHDGRMPIFDLRTSLEGSNILEELLAPQEVPESTRVESLIRSQKTWQRDPHDFTADFNLVGLVVHYVMGLLRRGLMAPGNPKCQRDDLVQRQMMEEMRELNGGLRLSTLWNTKFLAYLGVQPAFVLACLKHGCPKEKDLPRFEVIPIPEWR